MSKTALSKDQLVSELCPKCGLCCNGVLFGDVELQRADNSKRLEEAGMVLSHKGRKLCFNQQCACFDGKWCGIYADRPRRCRTFVCRLLKQVQVDELSIVAALRRIAEARRLSAEVRRLVRELGHTDEGLPLNRCYAELIAQPIDLAADDERVELRSKLMLAVDRLVGTLERDFLT